MTFGVILDSAAWAAWVAWVVIPLAALAVEWVAACLAGAWASGAAFRTASSTGPRRVRRWMCSPFMHRACASLPTLATRGIFSPHSAGSLGWPTTTATPPSTMRSWRGGRMRPCRLRRLPSRMSFLAQTTPAIHPSILPWSVVSFLSSSACSSAAPTCPCGMQWATTRFTSPPASPAWGSSSGLWTRGCMVSRVLCRCPTTRVCTRHTWRLWPANPKPWRVSSLPAPTSMRVTCAPGGRACTMRLLWVFLQLLFFFSRRAPRCLCCPTRTRRPSTWPRRRAVSASLRSYSAPVLPLPIPMVLG
eukprot:Opistho-2@74494